MTATTTRQPASPLVWATPILADLLGVGFFALANGWLTARFSRNAIDFTALQDAGLFALFHVAFLFGVTTPITIIIVTAFRLLSLLPRTTLTVSTNTNLQ